MQKIIREYELGLEQMTAKEYKVKTGISKQKIQRMQKKIKKINIIEK